MEENLKNWIMGVIQGDKSQFRYLVLEFEKKIFYYFLRMTRDYEDARDLTQNTFLRAFNYIKSYNLDYSFQSWLYSIAHNQLKDWWLRKKKDTFSIEEMEEKFFVKFSSDEEVLQTLSDKSLNEKVREAVNGLPDLYREIMLLLLVENQSYDEIAAVTELPLNTVKIRIHRARKLLRKVLEKWL